MNLFKRLAIAARFIVSSRSADAGWDDKWYQIWPKKTMAGTRIDERSAMTISALFSGLNFIASTIATLPKVIYERLDNDGGHRKAYEHPLYDRLHNKPNDSNLTAWQWIYTSIMHKYLWGNWYTHIDRRSYQNQQLFPMMPERTDQAGEQYRVRLLSGKAVYFPKSEVLHIPHISLDGTAGKGVIHYAQESLGIAKAQDEYAARFFGQGVHSGGFVEIDGPMEEETRKGLQSDFNSKYSGLGTSWKAIFLTGGAKYKAAEIDSRKAQALESRQFSIVEVARWTNLPPHLLRDLSKATYSNIEQQALELVVYSLLPITSQIEQAMNVALFDDTERRKYFVKFELKGLLRGDVAARTAFYESMLDRGVFNADQVLELEDMNPQPNGLGQIYMVPLNMVNKKMSAAPQSLEIQESSARPLRAIPDMRDRVIQITEYRTSALRRKLTIAYKKQFDAYGDRILEAELKALRQAVQDTLGERNATDFLVWLESFYKEFGQEVANQSGSLLSSYAEAILPVAQEEAGSDADISTEFDRFQADYQSNFASRHIRSSEGQLRAVVKQAQNQEESEIDAVNQRLDEWEEKRPGKISMRETIRGESAFTKSIFALSGISKIRSVAFGKSCPYCAALDGAVIEIQRFFLEPGEFQPEGAEKPLIVTSARGHPPYHDGCDCGIAVSI